MAHHSVDYKNSGGEQVVKREGGSARLTRIPDVIRSPNQAEESNHRKCKGKQKICVKPPSGSFGFLQYFFFHSSSIMARGSYTSLNALVHCGRQALYENLGVS